MNKKLIISAVVLLGVTAFFLLKDNIEPSKDTDASSADQVSTTEQESSPAKKTPHGNTSSSAGETPIALSVAVDGEIKKTPFIPENREEESMHKMNQKLQQVFENKTEPRELITFFEEENLAPEMSVNSNEYTGTMMMIRTEKSMPGARYFHAQYMGDDPEHTFLQHFSYQFKPGPKSLERAIMSAEGTFPLANKKIHRDGDFITYDIGDDGKYELSIEKANWESLKDDPYNAHTKEDVGTIITRIELKIHDEDEDHSDHVEP